MGLLRRVRFVRERVPATLGNTRMAARKPSNRDLAPHARHGVGSRTLLCRYYALELDVLLYCSYRLFSRHNRVLGCGGRALS